MNPQEYLDGVLKTESNDFEGIAKRLTPENIRLLHAAIGMCTEAAEFLDAIKKHLFYGKPLDKVNLVEEMGDSTWYMSVAMDTLKTTFEMVMKINNEKLRKRYGDKFTEEAAINRDLDKERKVLEGA